jgi:hypothetical protein
LCCKIFDALDKPIEGLAKLPNQLIKKLVSIATQLAFWSQEVLMFYGLFTPQSGKIRC